MSSTITRFMIAWILIAIFGFSGVITYELHKQKQAQSTENLIRAQELFPYLQLGMTDDELIAILDHYQIDYLKKDSTITSNIKWDPNGEQAGFALFIQNHRYTSGSGVFPNQSLWGAQLMNDFEGEDY